MKPSVSRTFLLIGLPVALGFVALIFGAMELRDFLLTSPKFSLKEVQVVTEGVADEDLILKRAAIPRGSNLFSLDLEEIRKRVEEDPWVHSATVVRTIPDQIQIHYRPQVPVAILGADSMYYLNDEGVPFYKIQKGDSLEYPLLQVEGKIKDKEILRERMESSLRLLTQLQKSPIYTEKDLGDMTVRMETEDGAPPYLLTFRFPPKELVKASDQSSRLYTASFGNEGVEKQVKRWEAVVRYLAQQGKNPRLIRLELGKKVVVKLDR